VLQEAPALIPPVWAPSGLLPTVDGAMNCVNVPAPKGRSFFRLAK
jgi:hypothetical protein